MRTRRSTRVLRALIGAIAVIGTPVLALAPRASIAAPVSSAPAQGDFAGLAATAQRDGSVRVIVELKTAATGRSAEAGEIRTRQDRVERTLGGDATVEHKLKKIPALTLAASADGIDRLRTSPDVARVTRDEANGIDLSVSTGVIQATTAWSSGITGAGTNVAILDTGVDTTHPMLSGKITAEACFTQSACPNGGYSQVGAGAAVPIHPHGTHVASTAAGRSWTSSAGMQLRGVAPDAGVIAIQVFQNIGGSLAAYDSSILSAIDWLIQLRATTPIAAANMSLGGGLYSTVADCDAARANFVTAFSRARSVGIAPVVASGNSGATGSISGPGCVSSAVSVGAVSNDTLNEIPSYSNVASWLTLFAPGGCGPTTGRAIYAAIPSAGAAGYCGTSMATPHVAGAFALLRQQAPTATVDDLVGRLQQSGAAVPSARNPGGTRAIRVADALSIGTPVPTTSTTSRPAATTTTTAAPAPAPLPARPRRAGYRLVERNGTVHTFGDTQSAGGLTAPAHAPIVAAATGGTTTGLWLAASSGYVFPVGDAPTLGDMRAGRLNAPVVAMSATPSANGYWLLGADGGIFNFGDAAFFGSTGNLKLNQPVNGIAPTPTGNGYWLVASDGGIFAFGDAKFFGSTGNLKLNQPIVGMAATPSGNGYWLVASDGGIFAFGDAAFYGSTGNIRLNQPIVGMAATADGLGYWMVASDGGIFTFGDAPYLGSTGDFRLLSPIVGMN